MDVILKPMTEKEFEAFLCYSAANQAEELAREKRLPPALAVREAEAELREMLPDRLSTKGHCLTVIENAADHRQVGYLWYLSEQNGSVRQLFLCDFAIYEPERRKGYAFATLQALEEHAEDEGCDEIVLFVSNENEPARKLYQKFGFVYLRDFDHGTYLKKKI